MIRSLCLALAVMVAPAARADTALDRLTLRSERLGWEAVGRLDVGSVGFCTGVLVAPDLVLTAAHCLYNNSTGARRDPTQMMFRAALRDGQAVAQVRVRRAVVLPGYDPLDVDQLTQLQNDAALLQLTQSIPAGHAAPFTVGRAVDAGDRVSVVSYARGRSEAPSWQRECRVSGRGQGAIAFTCDVSFGSSGAPVFETSKGRPRIVSIVSRGARSSRGIVAYGMEIAGPLRKLKAAMIAGDGVFPKETVTSRRVTVQQGAPKSAGGARFVRP
ncbi:trypsin-like serine peptidase [Actibacterium ureilyticum]|uniref:trypsin-like serine peptidase n=1 Tax=Actibacterium ureilyticum TaxID=1590614 RepID=UPI000BAAA458|nr:trypsin-like peptidase domain-containing protein [Actibacterium ureilyticum]